MKTRVEYLVEVVTVTSKKDYEGYLYLRGSEGWKLCEVWRGSRRNVQFTFYKEIIENDVTLHDMIGDATDLGTEEKESTY